MSSASVFYLESSGRSIKFARKLSAVYSASVSYSDSENLNFSIKSVKKHSTASQLSMYYMAQSPRFLSSGNFSSNSVTNLLF